MAINCCSFGRMGEAAWTIVEPILGDVTLVHMYEPGTWGPAQADLLANHLGGWHNPEASNQG